MSSSHGSNGAHGSGYSADVRLSLILNDGTRMRPGQVGPDRVIFREPVSVSPGPAVVEIVVDGRPHRWNVVLTPSDQADCVVPFGELPEGD